MRVRLIGIGPVGEQVVVSCVRHFEKRGIRSLLESHRVIHATSEAYQMAVSQLEAGLMQLLREPQEEMWLRGGLAYLFFQHPVSQVKARLQALKGAAALAPELEKRADLRYWREGLWPRVSANPALEARVEQVIAAASQIHADRVACHVSLLGEDWLLAPALPLETNRRFRRQNIGRKLMEAVLRTNAADLLVSGLGKKAPDGPDVDVVTIAFSAGDSFGVEGAERVAESIRTALTDPEATRVIAILGMAVFEGDIQSADGRCAGRYMGLQTRRCQLDGLIVRQATLPEDHEPEAGPDKPAPVRQAAESFAPLLAAIATASDPRVIQADNPDANQLQRDFGRRLFAAGFAEARQVPGVQPGQNMDPLLNLDGLYRRARENLVAWHSYRGDSPVRARLASVVQGIRKRYPAWAPPDWVVSLATAPGAPNVPLIEQVTARKVIVYIGHNGHLNASELRQLRRALARDFPRARTVVYKYRIDFPTAPVPLPASAVEAARAGGAAAPVAVHATGVPPLPTSNRAREAHLALFVVDGFITTAFERLSEFLRHNVEVRTAAGSQPIPLTQHGAIFDLTEALISRSLLSAPFDPQGTSKQPWQPPGLSPDAGGAPQEMRTAVRDRVLGGTDEEFTREMKAAVMAFVLGERVKRPGHVADHDNALDDGPNTEAQDAELTIREAASSLLEEVDFARFSAEEVADLLCGLNIICNESLEPRMVKRELIGCLEAIQVRAPQQGGYVTED